MSKIYAGIGSRDISPEIYELFVKIGEYLAKKGYVLRSGAATGSDQAFETGCDLAKGKKDIFVPWRGFEECYHGTEWTQEGWDMAALFHPAWDTLKLGARQMMARNSHQVLGLDLKTPVDFICCYTKGAYGGGGTGQALRIAKKYNIKIFDFGDKKTLAKFRKFCKNI